MDYSTNRPSTVTEADDEEADVAFYREKLQKLRTLCGLDKGVSVCSISFHLMVTDRVTKCFWLYLKENIYVWFRVVFGKQGCTILHS